MAREDSQSADIDEAVAVKRSPCAPRNVLAIWLLVALLVIIWTMRDPAVWATSLANPQRQTVPMTPPPTWTPQVTAVSPRPTRTKPEPPRRDTPSPQADPWLGLRADPEVIGPGSAVVITIEAQNLGRAPLNGARVTFVAPPLLTYTFARASSGQVQLVGSDLGWQTGDIGPGESPVLEIHLVVSEEALPEQSIPVRASMTWPGGQVTSNEGLLVLPWALLPETGA